MAFLIHDLLEETASRMPEQPAIVAGDPVVAFDRDGNEIVMIVGQLAADQLLAFRNLTGADVALLQPGSAGAASIWGRRIRVLTNAPALGPVMARDPACGG